MRAARLGDTVTVHFTIRLNDGTVLFTSEGADPRSFLLGDGIGLGLGIRALEDHILGMVEGQKKTVTVPADKAFGPHREELVMTVKKHRLPSDTNLEIGERSRLEISNGTIAEVTVTEMTHETVTLDANSPLAGKDIVASLEMVSISG